jgi:hypothetical protein
MQPVRSTVAPFGVEKTGPDRTFKHYRERWWTVVEMYGVLQLVGLNFGDECVMSYHIKITFPPPEHTYNYIAASINYTH